MRFRFPIMAASLLFVAVPALCQTPTPSPFTVEFDPNRDVTQIEAPPGKQGLWFAITFKIVRHGGKADQPGKEYKVVVYHDKREVTRLDVPPPKLSEELSAVLAIDISGSMARDIQGNKENRKRIDQARIAAKSFIARLPRKADCGLILFDHEIRPEDQVSPSPDRQMLLELVEKMQPRGGTAYLDATQVGIKMLAALRTNSTTRDKAVIVMTDGIDLNSTAKLSDVIRLAQKAKVKVHTIGIGEPGTGMPVNSVLALDHSQSMEQPADDYDVRPKIEALHKAAARFVTIMPDTARTTVLPFGSAVGVPDKLSNDKNKLIWQIQGLKPQGETAMLDAAYDAVATLEAANPIGHKAVVVMTDGIDNMSRHRPDDVILRAKEAGVAMYMLAFGRESELKQAKSDMQRIARDTGGSFHHARNEKDLIRIFEDMSNALHDDGIDVKSLTQLAEKTGGKYHEARDITKLKLILDQISQELSEKVYAVPFAAPHGYDGVAHKFAINLETASGQVVQEVSVDVAVRGVVIAEMNPFIYLTLLAMLGLLLVLPAALGRRLRSST
jgi:Mg-chelatase subunit ChlD